MARLISILSAALFALALTVGCNTVGCEGNGNSLPLAGLYSSVSGSAISVDSLEVGGIGAPGDSLLYTAGERLTEIYLPFRSQQPDASFFIRYARLGIADTISFAYDSTPWFAGEECGAMLRYRITRMTHTTHIIDSVAIADSLITNAAIRQIKIYLRTASEGSAQ